MTSTWAEGGPVDTKTTPGGGGGATTQATKNRSDPPISIDTLLLSAFMTALLIQTAERRLTPVAVDPIPAAVVVVPVSRHPHSVWPRRNDIVTLDPDIRVAVPTVKTGDPHVIRSRSHRDRFDHQRRRRDCHIDSRSGDSR